MIFIAVDAWENNGVEVINFEDKKWLNDGMYKNSWVILIYQQ